MLQDLTSGALTLNSQRLSGRADARELRPL
jgi:hypothetical protein